MNYRETSRKINTAALTYDMGLRSYFIKVFAFMGLGLGLTGLVAYGVTQSPEMMQMIYGGGMLPLLVVAFAPIGIALYMQFRIHSMALPTAQMLFWVFAALMGVSLSSILLAYTGESVARVFFITASMFGGMSLYGYTTKSDLTSWGSFLFMGLIGLIGASLVNMFLHSSGLQFIISIGGVVVFTGLTAYDVQNIKAIYDESDDADIAGKKAVIGALQLYLDFINLFISLIRLLGDRRS